MVEYRVPKMLRALLVGVPAIAMLEAPLLWGVGLRRSAVVVGVAFFLATVWNGVASCLMPFEMRLLDGKLHWRTLFRADDSPVDEITRCRPTFGLSNMQVIRFRSRRWPLLVWVHKGFVPFADALGRSAGDVPVVIGAGARLMERLPGRSWLSSGGTYRS